MLLNISKFMVIFISFYLFANSSNVLMPVRLIDIPKHLTETLTKDYPLRKTAMLKSSEVWLLGQRYLWKYGYKVNEMLKVDISSLGYNLDKTQSLVCSGKYIYVVLDGVIIQVNTNDMSVFTYFNKIDSSSKSVKFVVTDNEAHWTTNKGIYILDIENKIEKDYIDVTSKFIRKKSVFFKKDKKVWFVYGNVIREHSILDRNSNKLIFTADENFIDIKKLKNSVIAYTKYSILRFNYLGKMLSHVPVAGKSSLKSVNYSNKQHSFFLENGVLEVKDLENKTNLSYKLDNKTIKYSSLQINGSHFSLIMNGKPYFYELSGPASF